MKLLVTTEAHFFKTQDGKVWCEAIYQYDFWKRFINVFDKVRVIGRVKNVSQKDKKWLRVDGDKVEVWGIPFFQGPKQLLLSYKNIKKSLKNVYSGCDAVLYRIPSVSGQLVYKSIKHSIPFAVEVVYDPTDGTGVSNIIIDFISTIKFCTELKKICKKANGVSYVTKNIIQKKFPSHAMLYGESVEYFSSYYSTITLEENAYGKPKKYMDKKNFIIAHSNVKMNSHRKGEVVLLKALKYVRSAGYDVKVMFIGDGNMRCDFEKKAEELHISDYVEFVGLMPTSEAVRERLISADMFVFPTMAEGLPRGIIEAMAQGLPCISSPVGGIPELIENDYLVPAKDFLGYANKIIKLISDPCLMEKISENNIKRSLEFRNDILQKRRDEFYKKLYRLANINKLSS